MQLALECSAKIHFWRGKTSRTLASCNPGISNEFCVNYTLSAASLELFRFVYNVNAKTVRGSTSIIELKPNSKTSRENEYQNKLRVWCERKISGVWAIVAPISLANCVLLQHFFPTNRIYSVSTADCRKYAAREHTKKITIHQTLEWNTCSILFAGLISCNKLPFNVLLHNSARSRFFLVSVVQLKSAAHFCNASVC